MNILKRPWKISGIAGILFVALSFIASGIIKMPPTYNQDISTFAMWFSENGQWFRFGHCLAALAFLPFYFPFFAGFCEILKKAEGEPAILTRVTWAGAILSPAVGSIGGAAIMGIALLNGNASTEISQFGLASYFYAISVSGVFAGIAMIGAAIIILKTSVFKRWLGWAGLIIGFAAFISIGTLIENNPQGLFATLNGFVWLTYFLWIAVLSIEMIRMQEITLKS
ncbi:DUF4386 family protein [bacterium]|nr:DUF4386 family protein [bacterium]MBU1064925.1 DUF4386 family protein [bacterium]MBU1874898.1 DUF4386 family protein [bacterium]